MAESKEFGCVSASDHREEAATEALSRFQESVEELLRYKDIYSETAKAKKALLQLEAELRKKDVMIQELESAISVFTLGGNKEVNRMKIENAEVRKVNMDVMKKVEQAVQEKRESEAQLDDTRKLLTKKGQESAQLQKEISQLIKKDEALLIRLKDTIAAKDEIDSRFSAAKIRLEVYDGYTAGLIDLDIPKFSKSIARIWECTDALAKKYFSPDIPDSLLENQPEWIQQACNLLHPPSGSILIPPTNSAAAKHSRQAVVLNIIANILSKWIFIGAPISLAHTGIGDFLSDLMEQDAKKELLLRAMLISGSTEIRSRESCVPELTKRFLEAFGTLLRPTARKELRVDLQNLLENASDCWKEAQRSRQKVIATFNYESYPESWKVYSGLGYQFGQNLKHTQLSDPDDENEVAFFVFPAVIARSSNREATIHYGVLVYYSQLSEAENEWRKEQKKRRFSRTSGHHATIGSSHFS